MITSLIRWMACASIILATILIYSIFSSTPPDITSLESQRQWAQTASDSTPSKVKRPFSDFKSWQQQQISGNSSDDDERCDRIRKGMEDIFVVMKTGATEARQKVPVQLRTTLKCIPHYAIFSDYEETVGGVSTHNILQNISQTTQSKEAEFGLYHRLQKVGPEGLTAADFGDHSNGPFGKVNNPGWKLDKWKFLPMIAGALEARPKAKWYIFIEADTYIVWPNLVTWLSRLNHTENHYLGSQMQIGDVLFAHGGAGIILSSKTMNLLNDYQSTHQEELEQMTSREWAGDCALARALRKVHVDLTWAWPMMMTSRPQEIDHFSEAYGRQPWCFPAVSYHHMSPNHIEEMWRFDRGWFKSGKNALLLHGDVYRESVHNKSLATRSNWDNLSPAAVTLNPSGEASADACAKACGKNNDCLQFSFNREKQSCKHASTTFGGVPSNGTDSGWITHRVQRLLDTFQSSCPEVQWVLH
ncbi:O-fucosylpeptide 3-beta-N-acetylglucosaminyltransferase [Penicillium ucsense]|uniref:N-acetylgalactosaminide beta-1,3-galactosyltransferase n=1 Tax=Penicillium ucsense TaxID=2839758 RepID=A0A8J8WFN8_9EURO|nr:O-fucosylpeptide 3-beta-N-acetylglucosaminyltransferase [Penicillium ucsense]KAF7732648.1 O-fucosylpeptide 3-beta-N-acetylglucosaminyltransferase [Penicillium ucsense]